MKYIFIRGKVLNFSYLLHIARGLGIFKIEPLKFAFDVSKPLWDIFRRIFWWKISNVYQLHNFSFKNRQSFKNSTKSNTNFVEISQIWKFFPKASHDVLEFTQFCWVAVAFAFDDRCSQSLSGENSFIFKMNLHLNGKTYPCNRNPFDRGIHYYQYLNMKGKYDKKSSDAIEGKIVLNYEVFTLKSRIFIVIIF